MNLAVSFSGRKDGNCDRIAKYISAEDDLVFFMREISTQPCADCGYECMWGRCRYCGDGIYSFFDKLSTVDRVFYIVPMYCGNPSALYFILNERCQDYFMHNESRYEEIVEKLYIIGVYGSSEESPDFWIPLPDNMTSEIPGNTYWAWSGTGIIKRWGISC